MYESLLFLAWGITAVHLVVTERDGFSKSAIPGALAGPTAALTVAGATLALPAELQRATALVPALKSNWLMMHVSVMMLSYATLLVGSLSCVSYLVVDASQDWAAAKGALEKLDKMVSNDGERVRNRPKVSVAADGETVAVETMNASEDYGGELAIEARATANASSPRWTTWPTVAWAPVSLCSPRVWFPARCGPTKPGVRTGPGIRRRRGRSSPGSCTPRICTRVSSPVGVKRTRAPSVPRAFWSFGCATSASTSGASAYTRTAGSPTSKRKSVSELCIARRHHPAARDDPPDRIIIIIVIFLYVFTSRLSASALSIRRTV